MESGFPAGLKALIYRYRNCRAGYKIQLRGDGVFQVRLACGDVVGESDIAPTVLRPYRKPKDVQSGLSSEDPEEQVKSAIWRARVDRSLMTTKSSG